MVPHIGPSPAYTFAYGFHGIYGVRLATQLLLLLPLRKYVRRLARWSDVDTYK